MEVIYKNLKYYCEKSNLTISQLSEFLKLDENHIKDLLKGKREISLPNLLALADLLFIDLSDILEEDISKHKQMVKMDYSDMTVTDLNSFRSFHKIITNTIKLKKIYEKHKLEL